MRAAVVVLVLALGGGGSSCFYTFRQEVRRPVVGDGIQGRVDEATLHVNDDGEISTVGVDLVLIGATVRAIRQTWLADRKSEPCSGGLAGGLVAEVLRPEFAKAASDRVRLSYLPPETTASGLIPRLARVDVREKVVDLLFVRGPARTCLRLPFSGAEGEATPRWEHTFLGFVGASARIPAVQLGPRLGGATISAIAGGWVGPVRLWLEPGLVTSGDAIGLSANAEWVFLQRGHVAVGASAGYSAYGVGTAMSLLHGPGAALRVKWTLPRWLGGSNFPAGPQTSFAEVFVPVDFWSTNTGAATGPSFGIGVAVAP